MFPDVNIRTGNSQECEVYCSYIMIMWSSQSVLKCFRVDLWEYKTSILMPYYITLSQKVGCKLPTRKLQCNAMLLSNFMTKVSASNEGPVLDFCCLAGTLKQPHGSFIMLQSLYLVQTLNVIKVFHVLQMVLT